MTIGKRMRRGFTLVELLVVISIIGMLMALLLPAVQSARESGRSNTCRNNQRNLALAIAQYEAKNGYPGYVNELQPADAIETPRSWTFMLMPYLEHNDIWSAYSGAGDAQPTEHLEILQCPSDPPEGSTTLPPSSFVMNTGLVDAAPTATRAADFPGNGVGHAAIPYIDYADATSAAAQVTSMTSGYISSGDGLQNTILVTENADATSWVIGGTPANWEREVGCVWVAPDDTPDFAPTTTQVINGEVGNGTGNTSIEYARPGSYHPGGVNVAFCDGHVRFISETIDYAVFAMLMTPRGKASRYTTAVSPAAIGDQLPAAFRNRVLDEKDIE